MDIAADIIWFIHVLIVLWFLIIPFTNYKNQLDLYILIVPFLLFHWATNNDICALTFLEKILRNKKHDSDTFFYGIIRPIYIIPNNILGLIIKMITIGLFYYVLIIRTQKINIFRI